MPRIASLAAFVFSLALLASCGGTPGDGSSSGGGGGGSGKVAVQGFWSGTYTIDGVNGTNTATGAIVTNGDAFFYDQDGVLYVLPSFDGSASINSTMTAYAPPGVAFSDGSTVVAFDVVIDVTASAITGTFTGSNVSGEFTLKPVASPFSGNPSVLAGTWPGFYLTNAGTSATALSLTVQPAGIFVGTDANGCTLTGSLTQVASDTDLFTVTLDMSGSSFFCNGRMTGLAYQSNRDAGGYFGRTTGTYYYLAVSDTPGGFVAELKAN